MAKIPDPEVEIIAEGSSRPVNPEIEKAVWPWKCGVWILLFVLAPFVVLTFVEPGKMRCEERLKDMQKKCVIHNWEAVPEHCAEVTKYTLGRCVVEARDE